MNLSLGTAQFGSVYGITNKGVAPSVDNVHQILDMFIDSGNAFLDTAQEYGDAHEKISTWCKTRDFTSNFDLNITTKIHIKSKSDIDLFEENVLKILAHMGLKKLYGILIHNPADLVDKKDCERLAVQFKNLKQSGLVKKTGISVYDPNELLNLYDKIPEIDIVQCPVNILDQRFLQPNIQKFCMQNNIELHARSLFLQGLLLADAIPANIVNHDVISVFKNYQQFIKAHGLKALQSCCLFFYQNRFKMDRWVVGFNCPKETAEFLDQINKIEVHAEICFDEFKTNEHYIDPRTWGYVTSC